jgi:hypothetical protein
MATIVTINRKFIKKLFKNPVKSQMQSNHMERMHMCHKFESGSYMHHFHKVWWQLAFYRILKYVF